MYLLEGINLVAWYKMYHALYIPNPLILATSFHAVCRVVSFV